MSVELTKRIDTSSSPPEYQCVASPNVFGAYFPAGRCGTRMMEASNDAAIAAWNTEQDARKKELIELKADIRTRLRQNATAIEGMVNARLGAGPYARVYSRQLALDNVVAATQEAQLEQFDKKRFKGSFTFGLVLGERTFLPPGFDLLDPLHLNKPRDRVGQACTAARLGNVGLASLLVDAGELRSGCSIEYVGASDLTHGYLMKVTWAP